jgi:hypothetical protein
MTAFFRNPSAVRMTLTCLMLASVLLACAPGGQAQASLDKHARKIHKKLVRYPAGSYLHLILRGSSDNYGALGTVSDASFTFKSADTNAVSTYSYSDVARVKTDREPIGQGSEPEHHYIRPRTLIIVGVLAAGAGVAAVEVR